MVWAKIPRILLSSWPHKWILWHGSVRIRLASFFVAFLMLQNVGAKTNPFPLPTTSLCRDGQEMAATMTAQNQSIKDTSWVLLGLHEFTAFSRAEMLQKDLLAIRVACELSHWAQWYLHGKTPFSFPRRYWLYIAVSLHNHQFGGPKLNNCVYHLVDL